MNIHINYVYLYMIDYFFVVYKLFNYLLNINFLNRRIISPKISITPANTKLNESTAIRYALATETPSKKPV